MSSFVVFSVLLTVGTMSIFAGVSGMLGYRRREYIFPHYYSGGINYASIPLGVMVAIWAFIVFIPLSDFWTNILFITSLFFLGGGFVFNLIQPKFLEPYWYRWLNENHKDVMGYLRQDVRERGYHQWLDQTKTWEGMEAWVAEVRAKHNL